MSKLSDPDAGVDFDQWDAQLILEYIQDGLPLPPPPSAWEGEITYAHDNDAAWDLLDPVELGMTRAQARSIMVAAARGDFRQRG